jgi:CHAD domain-containing protein
MIDIATYLTKSERTVQRVCNRLDDYLGAPNEEHIHDIRTAIRRLQASYQTLPTAARNRDKMKEFVSKSKDLFSVNSKIRDCDIISEIVSKCISVERFPKGVHRSRSQPSQSVVRLLKSVNVLRNKKLNEAKTIALELRKLPIPSFDDYKTDISEKKIKNRFDKVITKIANRIEKNYPTVISSPERIRELHEMRKDCKKLRYLLELLPIEENDKDTDKDKVLEMIGELGEIQDMLGTIHDYDTCITYIKNHKSGRELYSLIELLYNDRQKKYDRFVKCYEADLSNSDCKLFLNIMNIS